MPAYEGDNRCISRLLQVPEGTNEFVSMPAYSGDNRCMSRLLQVPEGVLAKIVASMAMVVAVVIMALPISVVGTNFTEHWMAYKQDMRRQERTKQVITDMRSLVDCICDHNAVRAKIRLMSCLLRRTY